jgi:hypothetical protein
MIFRKRRALGVMLIGIACYAIVVGVLIGTRGDIAPGLQGDGKEIPGIVVLALAFIPAHRGIRILRGGRDISLDATGLRLGTQLTPWSQVELHEFSDIRAPGHLILRNERRSSIADRLRLSDYEDSTRIVKEVRARLGLVETTIAAEP